jgi:hypothetical protein
VTKNKDGTETIVTYHKREDGKVIKTTRRIKKTLVRRVVNPAVAERKQWAKFGQEAGKPAGPQTDTTSVAENIVFRPMANWKASAVEEQSEQEKKKLAMKDAKIKCRICSGDHWTTKCPFKDTMAPAGEATPAEVEDVRESAGGLGAGNSSYVPPHLRNRGAATGERMGGKYERDDLATLRVTNVGTTSTFSSIILLTRHRSASLPRSRIFEICSQDSVTLPESSLPRIARLAVQRDSLSSALRIVQMLPRLARRWMAVSGPSTFFHAETLTLLADGFGHLILRVEFAKKST